MWGMDAKAIENLWRLRLKGLLTDSEVARDFIQEGDIDSIGEEWATLPPELKRAVQEYLRDRPVNTLQAVYIGVGAGAEDHLRIRSRAAKVVELLNSPA